jgi:hypothetical protein
VRLAAGQRARIAAEKRQVWGEFLAKGHGVQISLEICFAASLARRRYCCNP